MPNTYNTLDISHVNQTFELDTVLNQRNVARADRDTGLMLSASTSGIIALKRVVKVIDEEGQELAYRAHRVQDSRLRSLSHATLNRRMQRDTRRLARQYGSNFHSLPVTTDWASSRGLTPEDGPITHEHQVQARHVPLYHTASHLFAEAQSGSSAEDAVPNGHQVFINTDATRLPIDQYDLILLGNGLGTAQAPDWTAFHDIVADARQSFDEGYRHGHSIAALLAAAVTGMRQAISSQT